MGWNRRCLPLSLSWFGHHSAQPRSYPDTHLFKPALSIHRVQIGVKTHGGAFKGFQFLSIQPVPDSVLTSSCPLALSPCSPACSCPSPMSTSAWLVTALSLFYDLFLRTHLHDSKFRRHQRVYNETFSSYPSSQPPSSPPWG